MTWREIILETWNIPNWKLEELHKKASNDTQFNQELRSMWYSKSRRTQKEIAHFYKDNILYSTHLINTALLDAEIGLEGFTAGNVSEETLLQEHAGQNKCLLEFGSGMGSTGFYACGLGYRVQMMDIDSPHAQVVCKAVKLLRNNNLHFSFVTYPDIFLEGLPGYYDIITTNQVLEHVKSPLKFIRLFYKSLFDNGYLWVDTFFDDCNDKAPYHLWENKLFNVQEYFDRCVHKIGFRKVSDKIWLKPSS